jgi:hypothetical protein
MNAMQVAWPLMSNSIVNVLLYIVYIRLCVIDCDECYDDKIFVHKPSPQLLYILTVRSLLFTVNA